MACRKMNEDIAFARNTESGCKVQIKYYTESLPWVLRILTIFPSLSTLDNSDSGNNLFIASHYNKCHSIFIPLQNSPSPYLPCTARDLAILLLSRNFADKAPVKRDMIVDDTCSCSTRFCLINNYHAVSSSIIGYHSILSCSNSTWYSMVIFSSVHAVSS